MGARERVLQYMQEHEKIDPFIAQNDLGCMRLSPRILDLKKKGYRIDSKTVKGKNRYGESVYWKEYWLVGGAER